MSDRLNQLIERLPTPQKESDWLSLEEFLLAAIHNNVKQTQKDIVYVLDTLCKKIDVTKKVCAFYNKDLSKPRGKTLLNRLYMTLLLGVLLRYAELEHDMKFLNSALKILDNEIEPRAIYPKFLVLWADRLVEDEKLTRNENN